MKSLSLTFSEKELRLYNTAKVFGHLLHLLELPEDKFSVDKNTKKILLAKYVKII